MIDDKLANETAVVTGAGRGLGRHVAVGLSEHGANLALVARSEDQLRTTENLVRSNGGRAISIKADVSRPSDVDRIYERVHDVFGTPSILINAAADPGQLQRIRDSDRERWVATLLTNTVGPYLICRAFVNEMIKLGWGRIINFSSAAAFDPPSPLQSAYATSKVALNHFTRHLAADLAGTGVTANVIHPGEVKTRMWITVRDEAQNSGPDGQIFREWVETVGRTGGDDPQKALDLVLMLINNEDPPNGEFHWIAGGLRPPMSTW